MWQSQQFSADLVTFTEEIVNGKLQFLCSAVTITSPSFLYSSTLGSRSNFNISFKTEKIQQPDNLQCSYISSKLRQKLVFRELRTHYWKEISVTMEISEKSIAKVS